MTDEVLENIQAALEAEGIKADEAIQEVTKEPEVQTTEGREFSEFEKEQMSKGWDPEGEKSAEEYARAEPLYDRIKAQSKQLKAMNKTIEDMKALMTKQEQLAYNKALETLKQEREEAILRGDLNAVRNIEQQHEQMTKQPDAPHPAVQDFMVKYDDILNSNETEQLVIGEFVRQKDSELISRGLAPEKHMQLLEYYMKKEFPAYFNHKEHVKHSGGVESGVGSNVARSSTTKRYTLNDLNSEQKKIAREFDKFGVMKIDDYIKSLVDLGELK